jgi:hypothetical protein
VRELPLAGVDDGTAFGAAMRAYYDASWPILNDPAMWLAEGARVEHEAPLAWPLPMPRTQAQRFLRVLAIADVHLMAALLHEQGHAAAPALPLEAGDKRLQLVLRVVMRANLAGAEALRHSVGGEQLRGRRAFCNASTEQWAALAADYARHAGITLEAAFAAFGLPRRQAFRARKRASFK